MRFFISLMTSLERNSIHLPVVDDNMSYYTISPPVCGELGPGTEVDHTTRPKTYHSVTFMVDG